MSTILPITKVVSSTVTTHIIDATTATIVAVPANRYAILTCHVMTLNPSGASIIHGYDIYDNASGFFKLWSCGFIPSLGWKASHWPTSSSAAYGYPDGNSYYDIATSPQLLVGPGRTILLRGYSGNTSASLRITIHQTIFENV